MSAVERFELPKWRCHKVVEAAKIMSLIDNVNTGDIRLCVESPGGGIVIPVTLAWVERHKPQPGGYFVRYEDGYESYSPAKAFEEGYKRIATDDHPRPTPRSFESLAPGYGGEP